TVLGMSAVIAPSEPPSEPAPPPRPRPRRLAMWAPVVAIAVAGGGLAWLYLGNGTQAAPKPALPAAATVLPAPAAPARAAQAPPSLRLLEEGYAFEVAPPEGVRAGVPLAFVVNVDDPDGKPLRGARLELGIRGPDKTQPEQNVVAHESAPGRYVAPCLLK